MTDKIKITEPNGGKHIAIAGDINSILASKDDTGGTYSVVEAKVFPDGGPVPHIQTREYEGFYVLEGEITFTVEGKEIVAKQGTFVNVPPHVTHSFKNKTDVLAKMLIILASGGMEDLFVKVGDEVSDPTVQPSPMSDKQMKKFADALSDYGVEIKH
ncbi:MAG: cupin domain-containing protein [Nitrosopumilus sp.]|nr:MAG: cupin domain-containing protein [Nitrosopumilus sp.]QMU55419.1 MAG: cupin domain-containing protein [Nitrosopumilus sp.]